MKEPQQDKDEIVTGFTGNGQFWKYHFKNVVFGLLKEAEPRVRKAGFRKEVSSLDAWRLHFPDPKNSDRLTIPLSVVNECKLTKLHEYALAYESPNEISWILVFIPLRGRALETMYTGQRVESPAFSVCPGGNQQPQLFQWEGTPMVGQKTVYTFRLPDYLWFPELFFWSEKVLFGQTSASSYSIQIPEILRVSAIDCIQVYTRKQRTGFAMAYDTLGNLFLFRQPLDFFRKV